MVSAAQPLVGFPNDSARHDLGGRYLFEANSRLLRGRQPKLMRLTPASRGMVGQLHRTFWGTSFATFPRNSLYREFFVRIACYTEGVMIDRHRVPGGTMKKTYFTIVYVILSVAALILASGAPAAYGGSGGG